MSRPDSQTIARRIPQAGDVAYFDDLDLDTVRDRRPSSQRSSSLSYTVDGKCRPMYVLAVKWKRKRRHFQVVPITHTGKDEKGAVRDDRIFIGKCITEGDDKDSFFRLPAEELRERLLRREDGRSPVVEPCNRFAFECAIRKLNDRLVRDPKRDDATHD